MRSKKPLYFLFLAIVVSGLVVLLLVRQDNEDSNVVDTPATAQPEQPQDDVGSQPRQFFQR